MNKQSQSALWKIFSAPNISHSLHSGMVVLRNVLAFLAVAVVMQCVTGQSGQGRGAGIGGQDYYYQGVQDYNYQGGQNYYHQGGQDYNYQGVQDYNYPGQGGFQGYQGRYRGLKGRYQLGYQGKTVCDKNIVSSSYVNLGQSRISFFQLSNKRPMTPSRPTARPVGSEYGTAFCPL
jgi:hypothetical protein